MVEQYDLIRALQWDMASPVKAAARHLRVGDDDCAADTQHDPQRWLLISRGQLEELIDMLETTMPPLVEALPLYHAVMFRSCSIQQLLTAAVELMADFTSACRDDDTADVELSICELGSLALELAQRSARNAGALRQVEADMVFDDSDDDGGNGGNGGDGGGEDDETPERIVGGAGRHTALAIVATMLRALALLTPATAKQRVSLAANAARDARLTESRFGRNYPMFEIDVDPVRVPMCFGKHDALVRRILRHLRDVLATVIPPYVLLPLQAAAGVAPSSLLNPDSLSLPPAVCSLLPSLHSVPSRPHAL